MSDQHLIIIDASGIAHRAYHTGVHQFRHSDGLPTWAITGFLGIGWRLLGAAAADQPTHGVAVFDAPGKTFRHELYREYKNHRPARDEELAVQMPYMRHAAEALGLVPMERQGFEADDLIATLATRAMKDGIRVSIVSNDKDMNQLVIDGEIEIIDPVAKIRIRTAEVVAKFGVRPNLVPDVQALAGDTVDNITGIPGCGLGTAGKMVRRWGDLEQVLKHHDDCGYPKVRAYLRKKENADKIRMFLKLTRLRRNVPLRMSFESLRLKPIMESHLDSILATLDATGRKQAIFGLGLQVLRSVPKAKDAMAWWREALFGPSKEQLPDDPQCGYYTNVPHKGAKPLPARIWRDPEFNLETDAPTGRDILRAHIGGKARDPREVWVRLSMNPIPEAEYRKMMKLPPEPEMKPTLSTVKSIPNPARKKHVRST